MAPAFTSPRRAAAFTLLILGLLLLPELIAPFHLVPRSSIYGSMPFSTGPFAFLRQAIFEEKSDLDIVFVGSSPLLYGVDTPLVQRELSAKLGRPARVITVGSYYCAEDKTYLLLRDLLRHRRVKMVVLGMMEDDVSYTAEPYSVMYRFFQEGEDAPDVAGLPLRWRAAFYAGAVLGAPRLLQSALFPPLEFARPPFANTLGMVPIRTVEDQRREDLALVPFHPPPPELTPDSLIYSDTNRASFHFQGRQLSNYQRYFLARMGQLSREHGVHLVILDLPPEVVREGDHGQPRALFHPADLKPDIRAPAVEMFCYWPDVFGVPLDMLGVPKARLFNGLSPDQVRTFYSDIVHLNPNGRPYFTRAIMPALFALYDRANPR